MYSADLSVSSLAGHLEIVRAAGNARVATQTLEEQRNPKKYEPLFRATGVSTWRQLEDGGALYAIKWSEEGVRIDATTPDTKRPGYFGYDPARERNLRPDTPVEEVARVLLEDARSRPELLNSD